MQLTKKIHSNSTSWMPDIEKVYNEKLVNVLSTKTYLFEEITSQLNEWGPLQNMQKVTKTLFPDLLSISPERLFLFLVIRSLVLFLRFRKFYYSIQQSLQLDTELKTLKYVKTHQNPYLFHKLTFPSRNYPG